MRSLVLGSVLSLAISAGCLGQAVADFAGVWRVYETHNFSPNSSASPSGRVGYTIAIRETARDLYLSLPKLPALVFHLDGSDNGYVHDNGDSWTKFRTSIRWDGSTLVLTATSWNGWWKDSRPTDVTEQETQLEETRVLSFGADSGNLRMETSARDEKPFVPRYVDLLVRVRQ